MAEKNYYREMHDAFRKKREIAEIYRDVRLAELHEKFPEIVEIDKRLSRTGSLILDAMKSEKNIDEAINRIRQENDELRKKRGAFLEANAYPADYTDVRYECERCGDSGYVGLDMCVCMKTAIARARLEDSELGRVAATQNFDNFDLGYYNEGAERDNVSRHLKLLRGFAEGFNEKSEQSWLLLGGTGLGKTHLSTAVGVAVISKGYDVVYKTVQSVMDDYQQVQFRGGDAECINKYYDCDLLIVDDLGAEMATQFTVSCIYNLINTRMNKRKPTIFSTNLTQTELRDRYADRITSRLFGEYIPLVFKGTDVRRQKLTGKKGGR